MDKKKRRSSMKKKTAEEDNTAVSSTSKFKRISFSGKKSVRVFREDVIIASKPYDNSYEESDHAGNGSGDIDTLGHNIVNVHQKRIALRNRVVVAPETNNCSSSNRKEEPKIEIITKEVHKENCIQSYHSTAQHSQIKIVQSELKSLTSSSSNHSYQKSWNKTMDFINNTHGSDTTLRVENSVDLTLTEQELRHGVVASNTKDSKPSLITYDPRPSISFSLEDNEENLFELKKSEIQILENNKKINYDNDWIDVKNSMVQPLVSKIRKLHVLTENEKSLLANKTNAANLSIDLSEDEFDEVEKISKCSRKTVHDVECMKESFSMNYPPTRKIDHFSIHMDESIENRNNTFSNDLRRKTIKNNYDMELELSGIYEIQNKENIPENMRRKTIINDNSMELSEMYHIQSNKNTHNDLRRKTVNNVENMELSGIEPIESQECKLQLIAKNTTKINDLTDCDVEVNSSKFDVPNEIVDFVTNATSNFIEELNRISLKATTDGTKRSEEQFEESFKSTILPQPKQKEQEDQYSCEMELSMDTQDTEKSNKLSKDILQKTIYFNDFSKKLDQDLETSPSTDLSALDTIPANKRKTIVFNNEESLELDFSKCNAIQKTGSEGLNFENAYEKELEPSKQLRVSSKTGTTPKVVVVRKTCATRPKQEKITELQFQRFQRYQNKQKDSILNEAKEKITVCTNLNHSKIMPSSADQSFMSPDSQSLFPPHCQQYSSRKKINFRQLNEEIENGKIQLFPDSEKMPKNKHQNSKITTETSNEKKPFRNKILFEDKLEIELSPFAISTQSKKKSLAKSRTLLMPSDIELEQSQEEHETDNISHITKKIESIKSFNLAKHILQKKCDIPSSNLHSQEDSFDVKLKEAREATLYGGNNNLSLSPLPNTDDQEERMRRLYEGTPHRSVLEFEHLEKESKNESNGDINLNASRGTRSPIDMEIDETLSSRIEVKPHSLKCKLLDGCHDTKSVAGKSLVFNVPKTKKRQTQHFNNCDLEESYTNKTLQANESSGKTGDYEKSTNQKNLKSTAFVRRNTICEPVNIDIDETNTNNKECTAQIKKEINNAIDLNKQPVSIESENQKQKMSITKRQSQFYADCDFDESNMPRVKENFLKDSNVGPNKQSASIESENQSDAGKNVVCNITICEPIDVDLDETNANHKECLTQNKEHVEHDKKIINEDVYTDEHSKLNACDIKKEVRNTIDLNETNCNEVKVSGDQYKITANKQTEGDSSKETEYSKHSTFKITPVKFPIIEVNTQKRNTSNLTPNLLEAKKRHTELFNSYDIEEQLHQQSDVIKQSENTDINELLTKRETLLYRETIKVENAGRRKHKSILLPQAMEVEDNSLIADESYCKIKNPPLNIDNTSMDLSINCSTSHPETNTTPQIKITPTKTNRSRIPILIESAKENSSIKSRFYSPRNTSASLINQTIQTPRRAISKHIDQSLYIVEQSIVDGAEKSHCVQQTFEDNPITISDVSVHYLAQKKNNAVKDVIFNEKAEDTQSNAKFFRNLVDVTFESPLFCSETDEIDDTRISLVGTLLDEDDSDGDDCKAHKSIETLHVSSNITKNITKPVIDIQPVCRNCKRCQNTISSEDTLNVTDSFALPAMPPLPDLGIERLNRLRAKPTINETLEYWRRDDLAANTYHISDEESEEDPEFDGMLKKFEETFKRYEKVIEDKLRLFEKIEKRKPFFERWDIRLRKNIPNWIFNFQMVIRNFCQFDHKKIITFCLVVIFEPKDPLRNDVIIECIKLQPSRVPISRWKPIDFILDFQLKLELPYNVNQLYHNESNVDYGLYNALEECDKVCVRVHELGMLFWKTVCRERATLIRGTHNTYIQKVVRKLIPPNNYNKFSQVQRTEFKIEVTNIRKISFKDIVSPPLHLFRENLENLPIGLEFLSAFLRDPVSYLKD